MTPVDFNFSSTRPSCWASLCDANGAFFGSGAWQDLLQKSFDCRTIYAFNSIEGFAITVFRGGPFTVGYLGFPIGGSIGLGDAKLDVVAVLKSAHFGDRPTCVRIPCSTFDQHADLNLPYESNPETIIRNLQSWKLESVTKNLRRDIKKAERSGLVISKPESSGVGADLFKIYSHTVSKHGGVLRYNIDYFVELIKLANVDPRLSVLTATHGAEIAGFVVTASHGDTAYYLHGGASAEYRKNSPSDLLLNRAIHDAQQDGRRQYSLMASPPGQPTLVRYKEKWGGTTHELRTYTVALRPSYLLFKIAERAYRMIR